MLERFRRLLGASKPANEREEPQGDSGPDSVRTPKAGNWAELVRDLESDSPEIRERAVLSFLATGADSVPYLQQCLSSARHDAAIAAAAALGRLGAIANPSCAALIIAAVSRDARLRAAAAKALPLIDPDWSTSDAAAEGARRVVDLLGKRCDTAAALHVLAQLGPQAIVPLTTLLADPNDNLRQSLAAQALTRIGSANSETLDALAIAFRDGPVHVRRTAAEAMAAIGQSNDEVRLLLIDAIHRERDPSTRQQVVRAIARVFEPPSAAALIVWSLADSEDAVNTAASIALADLGGGAVPALVHLMKSIPQLHRKQLDGIDELLAEHRLSSQPAKRLSHEDFFIEATWKLADRRAAEVLREIGSEAVAAIDPLVSRIHSDDPKMRRAVAEALGSIAPQDSKVIEALTCLAKDKNPDVREAAEEILNR